MKIFASIILVGIAPIVSDGSIEEHAKNCGGVKNFSDFTGCYLLFILKCSWGVDCVRKWDTYGDFKSISTSDICNKHWKDLKTAEKMFIGDRNCRGAVTYGYKFLINSNIPGLPDKMPKYKHCINLLCSR